jgi:hypothetical protein
VTWDASVREHTRTALSRTGGEILEGAVGIRRVPILTIPPPFRADEGRGPWLIIA